MARQDEAGQVIARRLERDDDDDNEGSLQGFVEAIDQEARTLTVLRATITAEPRRPRTMTEMTTMTMIRDE